MQYNKNTGIQASCGVDPGLRRGRLKPRWIPAFAGMTWVVTVILFLFFPLALSAVEEKTAFIPPKYEKQIKEIEHYLSGFKTMQSRFSQISGESGEVSEGTIAISRPGNLRLEYLRPDHVLAILNGKELSYYDYGLDQVSYGTIPDTPFEVLLYQSVTFEGNSKVADVVEDESSLSIQIVPDMKNEKEQSKFTSLSLVFAKNPMVLKRIIRTDALNHSTTVFLIDPKLDAPLDDDLFIFKNPRTFGERHKG